MDLHVYAWETTGGWAAPAERTGGGVSLIGVQDAGLDAPLAICSRARPRFMVGGKWDTCNKANALTWHPPTLATGERGHAPFHSPRRRCPRSRPCPAAFQRFSQSPPDSPSGHLGHVAFQEEKNKTSSATVWERHMVEVCQTSTTQPTTTSPADTLSLLRSILTLSSYC